MPEPIVTPNENALRADLRELVRKTVEDTLNGLLEEGRMASWGRPLRAHGRARGLPRRPLRLEPRDHQRRRHAAHAQAQGDEPRARPGAAVREGLGRRGG